MKNIKAKDIKRFRRLTQELNELMHEICEYSPDAEIYVEDSWNFNLMKGPTHDDKGTPQRQNVVAHETVYRSSGGGW